MEYKYEQLKQRRDYSIVKEKLNRMEIGSSVMDNNFPALETSVSPGTGSAVGESDSGKQERRHSAVLESNSANRESNLNSLERNSRPPGNSRVILEGNLSNVTNRRSRGAKQPAAAGAAATAPDEEDDRELWCAICLSVLRRPRQLPCGHAYCLHCLTQLVNRDSSRVLCPSCRRAATVPPGGVEDLPVDAGLLLMVQRSRERRRERIMEDRKQSCSRCRTLSLCASCPHCSLLHCSPCFSHHARQLRAHVDSMTYTLQKLKKQLQVENNHDSNSELQNRLIHSKSLSRSSRKNNTNGTSLNTAPSEEDQELRESKDTKRVLYTLTRALSSSKSMASVTGAAAATKHRQNDGVSAAEQAQMERLAHQRVFLLKLMASLESRLTATLQDTDSSSGSLHRAARSRTRSPKRSQENREPSRGNRDRSRGKRESSSGNRQSSYRNKTHSDINREPSHGNREPFNENRETSHNSSLEKSNGNTEESHRDWDKQILDHDYLDSNVVDPMLDISHVDEVQCNVYQQFSRNKSRRRSGFRSRSKDRKLSVGNEKHPYILLQQSYNNEGHSNKSTSPHNSSLDIDESLLDSQIISSERPGTGSSQFKRSQSSTRSRSRSQSRNRSLKAPNRSRSRVGLRCIDIDIGEDSARRTESNMSFSKRLEQDSDEIKSHSVVKHIRFVDQHDSNNEPDLVNSDADTMDPRFIDEVFDSSDQIFFDTCAPQEIKLRHPSLATVSLEQTLEDNSLLYRCKPSCSQQRLRNGSSLRRPTDVAWCHWNNVLYVTASRYAKVIMFSSTQVWRHTTGRGTVPGGIGSPELGKPSGGARHSTWGVRGNSPGQLLCPSAIACSPVQEELYVLDKWRCRVLVFTLEGGFLREWGAKGDGPGEMSAPEALTVDKRGLLYLADTCNDRIQVLDRNGRPLREVGGPELRQPAGVAVSGDGATILVADTANHRCRVYCGITGKLRLTFGGRGSNQSQMESPECVALDPCGFMLVGDSGNNRIQIFRPNGNFVRYLGSRNGQGGELRLVAGLVVSPALEVIAVDFAQHAVMIY